MAPTFVGRGAQFAATAATTAAWPAGHQAGDVGILVIETAAGDLALTISGWTAIYQISSAQSGSHLQIFWKRAVSSAEPVVTIPDAGNHQIGAIHVFRNAFPGANPFQSLFTSSEIQYVGTTVELPSLNVEFPDSTVFLIVSRANDNASTTFFPVATFNTPTVLGTITEAGECGAISGDGGGFTFQYATAANSGSTNTGSIGPNAVGDPGTQSFLYALRPNPLLGRGTFAVSGQAATLKRNASIAANSGQFDVTGRDAALNKGKGITCETGAYFIFGVAANLKRFGRVAAAPGSYLIAGRPVTENTVSAGTGVFNVNTNQSVLKYSKSLAAGTGIYSVDGVNADFGTGIGLIAARRNFIVTGKDAILTRFRDPQVNLNESFPGAVAGDAVVDEATNDVWIYNGSLWINSGAVPGENASVSQTIPVYLETVKVSSIVGPSFGAASLAYALNLPLKEIEPLAVSVSCGISLVVGISLPEDTGKITITPQDPDIRQGAAVLGLLIQSILIDAGIPSVTAVSGIGIPDSIIEVVPYSPTIASAVKTITVGFTQILVNTYAPTLINISDPFWANVVFLLRAEGDSWSEEVPGRYFVDVGPYGLTVRTTAKDSLGFSQPNVLYSSTRTKWGNNSALFWDQYSLLKVAADPVTVIGTDQFTVELWIYINELNATDQMILGETGLADSGELMFLFDSTSFQVKKADTNEGFSIAHGGLLTVDTWHHLALTRDGSNNARIFLNGVQVGTTQPLLSDFSSVSGNQGALTVIGGDHNGGNLRAFVEDLRITKGVARYVANFSVPTEAFEGNIPDPLAEDPDPIPFSHVELLLHGYGAAGSTTITDSSSHGVTVINTGCTISDRPDPFGLPSGVIKFTSSVPGSYLSLGTSAGLVMHEQPFCIEFWLYALKPFALNEFPAFGSDQPGANVPSIQMAFDTNGNGTVGNFDILKTPLPISLKKWYHIAYSRDSLGEARLFIDGKLIAYPEFLANYLPGYYWTGNGKKNFNSQITRINRRASDDPYYDDVSFRTEWEFNFDPADTSLNARLLYVYNLANTTTADKYYGSTSSFNSYTLPSDTQAAAGYFINSSQHFNDNDDFKVGFNGAGTITSIASTIEAFVKPTGIPIGQQPGPAFCVIARGADFNLQFIPTADGVGSKFVIWDRNSFDQWTNSFIHQPSLEITIPAPGIALNQWHHIAITTDGLGNMFFWLNGNQVGWALKNWRLDTFDGNNASNVTLRLAKRSDYSDNTNVMIGYVDGIRFTKNHARYTGVVGAQTGGTYQIPTEASMTFGGVGNTPGLNGYMCDIRITKGFARYTRNFNVPTGRFLDSEPLGIHVLVTGKVNINANPPLWAGSRPFVYALETITSTDATTKTVNWPAGSTVGDFGLLVIAKEGLSTNPIGTPSGWQKALAFARYSNASVPGQEFSTYGYSAAETWQTGATADDVKVYAYFTKVTVANPPSFTLSGDPSVARKVPIRAQAGNRGGSAYNGIFEQRNDKLLGDDILDDYYYYTAVDSVSTMQFALCSPDFSGGNDNQAILACNGWGSFNPSSPVTIRIRYAKADSDGANNDFVNPVIPVATGNNVSFTVGIGGHDDNNNFVTTTLGGTTTTDASGQWSQITINLNDGSILAPYFNNPIYERPAIVLNVTASGGGPNAKRGLAVSQVYMEWPGQPTNWVASFAVVRNASTHVSAEPFLGISGSANNALDHRSGLVRLASAKNIATTPATTCTGATPWSYQYGSLIMNCFVSTLGTGFDGFNNDASSADLLYINKEVASGVSTGAPSDGSIIQFVSGYATKCGDIDPMVITKTNPSKYIALTWSFDSSPYNTGVLSTVSEYSARDGKPLLTSFEQGLVGQMNVLANLNGLVGFYMLCGCEKYTSCMFATDFRVYRETIGGFQQEYTVTSSANTYVEEIIPLIPHNLTDAEYDRRRGLKGNPSARAYVEMPNFSSHWFCLTEWNVATTISDYGGQGECIYGSGTPDPGKFGISRWCINQDTKQWMLNPFSSYDPVGVFDVIAGNASDLNSSDVELAGFSNNSQNGVQYGYDGLSGFTALQGSLTSQHSYTPWLFGNNRALEYDSQFANGRIAGGGSTFWSNGFSGINFAARVNLIRDSIILPEEE